MFVHVYAVSAIIIRVVIDKIIHGSQYLRGHTIQEVRGEVAIGPSIYGVYVIDGSLCSRVYGITATERGINSEAAMYPLLTVRCLVLTISPDPDPEQGQGRSRVHIAYAYAPSVCSLLV